MTNLIKEYDSGGGAVTAPSVEELYDWLKQLQRMEIPGGCEFCPAVHTVGADVVTVYHGAGCPTLGMPDGAR